MTLGKIHQVIPSIFGLLLLFPQSSNFDDFLPGLLNPMVRYTSIPGLDNLLNFLVPFYQDFIKDSSSILIINTFFPLVITVLFTVALEASIPGVRGLVTNYFIIALLTQFLGISMAITIIWVPAWIISEKRKEIQINNDREGIVTTQQYYDGMFLLNPGRVNAIFYSIFGFAMFFMTAMVTIKNEKLQAYVTILFLFAPLLAPIFWNHKSKTIDNNNSSTKSGYKLASYYYKILFGVSIYQWMLFLLYAVDNKFQRIYELTLLCISGGSSPSINFMIINSWVTITGMSYWVFVAEGGHKFTNNLKGYLLQLFIFGPSGALALYCSKRYEIKNINTIRTKLS
ncbi:10459_t:CDS:2 [Entrophospora sp. SA101]|nr:10415_t:CDS:2 [Entrophospora sp. SA101]CAJ0746439.1 8591_t:CDS:2 [Entrophospora sp. SA101]CAJ0754358.1 13725_t:CDS:2 [Entrophospora sp. SA101]CAJ0758040.1 10459_t:CDS:2 [Entrophospora sp. SA101]